MRINPADTRSGQGAALYQIEDFAVRRDRQRRQIDEEIDDRSATRGQTERNFTNNKWVRQDLRAIEQRRERRVSPFEVVHPDGGIHQNH